MNTRLTRHGDVSSTAAAAQEPTDNDVCGHGGANGGAQWGEGMMVIMSGGVRTQGNDGVDRQPGLSGNGAMIFDDGGLRCHYDHTELRAGRS